MSGRAGEFGFSCAGDAFGRLVSTTGAEGTVWGYADARGEVVARWTYDAWGNVLSEEIAEGSEALREVRYRFQGRERSAATGLVSFRMRWYDPETGRWLSKGSPTCRKVCCLSVWRC